MPLAAVIALALVVSPSTSQRAATLSRRSILEYNAGDFAKALVDAQAAYELDPRPLLLFNLGQCHRAMGDVPQALFSYRGYLRERPDAPNREAVLELIKDLEAKLTPSAPAVTPPPVAVAPTPVVVLEAPAPVQPDWSPAASVAKEGSGRGLPGAFWWLGGSAVATGAAGTILGVLAHSALASDSPTAVEGYKLHTVSSGQYQIGQSEGLAADILWSVGGVLLVSAVVVALTR